MKRRGFISLLVGAPVAAVGASIGQPTKEPNKEFAQVPRQHESADDMATAMPFCEALVSCSATSYVIVGNDWGGGKKKTSTIRSKAKERSR